MCTHFQTELANNTNLVISGTHYDIVDAQANVSDIHCGVVESQEGTGGQNQLVSFACTLIATELTLSIA